MRLPGFTAEASLTTSTTSYQLRDIGRTDTYGQDVKPQISLWNVPSRLWRYCQLYPAAAICNHLVPPVEIPLTGLAE
jgi:hypothetical protein